MYKIRFLEMGRLIIVVLLVGLSLPAFSQQVIKGTVMSGDDNTTLPGVTIIKKGTGSGTTTDFDGNFSIEASANETLVFSYVGYMSQEKVVGDHMNWTITLEVDVSALEEVIVTGYSQKTKSEISASVVTLNSKDIQSSVTSSNLGSMLQGKIAGMTVNSASGAPGAAPDIRIRGITSINADKPPLFVIDGMIGGNYVPTNVETVTVLKDAAAIGLYGSRGAAGVVIITTKKSKSAIPEFSLSSRMALKEATRGNFSMMDGETLYDTQEKMWGDDRIGFLKLRPQDLRDQNFDWLDAGFQKALLQNYTFSVLGQTEKLKYVFDVDYFDEEGTFRKTDYERLNLHTNIGYSGSEIFSINTDVNVQYSKSNFEHYSWFEDAYWSLPWDNPYYEDGRTIFLNGSDYDPVAYPWYGQFRRNFLHSQESNKLSSSDLNTFWSTRMVLNITNWLSVETRTRLNSFNSRTDTYYSNNSHEGVANNGEITVRQSEGYGALSTHIIRASQDFGNHHIAGFIAHEGDIYNTQNIGVDAWNLSPGIEVLSGASTKQFIEGREFTSRGISYMGELTHGFKDKFFSTVVYRIDGSSNFASDKKYAAFPAASFAWVVSKESFLQNSSFVDLLKLRISYGLVGNDGSSAFDEMNEFPFLATYNISGQYNGQPAASPLSAGNDKLGWETTTMLNLGMDMSIIRRDLFMSIDVYNKNVDDMLFNRQLAFSGGIERRWENIGSMNNKGVEIALNYQKSFGEFRYEGSFNLSYNKNEITKITDTEDEQILSVNGVQQINKVGQEAFTWYMPKWLGVNSDNGAPMWEEIVYDNSGNEVERRVTSVYSEATFQPISSALPKFSGGFTNRFSYKGLSLSVLLTYQGGNKIYHSTREFVDADGANTGINFMNLIDGWSRWEKPGDQATHPVLERGDTDGSHFTSSRYIEDGDYVRIRNITLSYNLPKAAFAWAKIRSANLSVGVDNLHTFTEFSGVDADVNMTNLSYALPGMAYNKYPISKQYIVGLNIKF
ncbi:SusC/RagA family TonB-linked outer membrane protein [Reichenbachiella faecimaris]|nr:SusC/RagA family TonB-linked outer membrane protein [Reichenbachiella faecimaris]